MLLTELQLSNLDEVKFEAGHDIIRQGTPGTKVYVMVEGSVAVELDGKKIKQINESGAILGEISSLLGRNHGASVRTLKASRFYVIDDLPTFVRRSPEIAIEFLRIMAQRVVTTNAANESLPHI